VDADTFIDNNSFEALIRPFLSDSKIVAMGASVRIKNGCSIRSNKLSTEVFPQKFLPGVQAIEYLRAFLMREGWDYAGGNFCLSGAFACFVKEVVIKAGGFAPTFGNDLEIIVRLHRVLKETHTSYRILYLPDPVAWTVCPSTLKRLGLQRMLWHRGLMEAMWFHKSLFFNPKYKTFGLFVFPFMFFGEVLEPIVEVIGYLYILVGLILGIVHIQFILLFLCLTWGFTLICNLFCLIIEEFGFDRYTSFKSLIKLFACSLTENLGYRQLTLLWRLNGFRSFIKRFHQINQDSHKINQSLRKN